MFNKHKSVPLFLSIFLMFILQNNDRGGYNVGDRTNEAFDNADDQYQMVSLSYIISGKQIHISFH